MRPLDGRTVAKRRSWGSDVDAIEGGRDGEGFLGGANDREEAQAYENAHAT